MTTLINTLTLFIQIIIGLCVVFVFGYNNPDCGNLVLEHKPSL